MPSEACLEEFEALSAIFLEEIEIGEEDSNGSTTVTMVLYPATGDDQESKYVTLTLELNLPADYPQVSPKIRFRNPRGLSESLLNSLYNSMVECCRDREESQMVFELIDMVKEFLTKNNRPASECPICLHSFTPCDIFFRSQCFHHFHSYCLGRYLQNVVQTLATEEHLPGDAPGKTCPVCRDTLNEDIDVDKLLQSPPPFEESTDSEDGNAVLKKWHREMEKLQALYNKQKSQGGIIDLSEYDKKRLVISSPRPAAGDGGGDSPSSSSELSSVADGDLLLVQPASATTVTGASQPIPLSRNNPRNDTHHQNKPAAKDSSKEKYTPQSNGSQNGEVKSSVVAPKTGQQPTTQESETAQTRTSPNMGRHHGRQGYRGKGSYHGHGNGRRRYK